MMMMMMGGENGRSCRCPCPFTASQWQELEHQALIFQYMASGIPVPYDLILPIKRGLLQHPPASKPLRLCLSLCLPLSCDGSSEFDLGLSREGGGSCFQMGNGRKGDDPEPWRCRRTDGKKWRCSKEAHPDSKYCERHMHRGKNRSRKLVELSLATNASPSAAASSHVSSPFLPALSPLARESRYLLHPACFPSRPPSVGFSPEISAAHYRAAKRNHGEACGFKEALYEQSILREASVVDGNRPWSWRHGPVRTSSMVDPEQNSDHKQSSASSLTFDSSEEEKHQHCFVLGADFKSGEGDKMEREAGSQKSMPFHCFIDERPQRREESWVGPRLKQASELKTQLSISMSMADRDLFGQGD